MRNKHTLQDSDIQRVKSWNRRIHLPMIVSIPLLIGLLVLTTGIINKNILITTALGEFPGEVRLRLEQSLELLDNLTYVSAALASVAGLVLALIIVRPIRRLSSAMSELADRGVAQQVDFTQTATEIGELGQSFNRVMALISSSLPERARFLFHNMASGVIAFDGEGIITTINSAADKMLELRGVGVKNQYVQPFLKRFGHMDELIELLEEARLQGKNYAAKPVRVTTISGREVNLAVTTTTVADSHNQKSETIATIMDLSRIQQIDQQIQQSDKLSSLGTLAAGVAHEIRNPLASLRGLTQLLGEDLPDDDPKRKYAKVILEEVDRLNTVVQQLLDFSAVSKEESHQSDLNELLRRALQLAQPVLKKRPAVRLELELSESLPAVGVYQRKMIQAFLNVLLNAIEAVDETGTVRITSRATPERVVFDIANTGSYIEPEQRRRIFDPFFTSKDRGTGLGLAITHQIVSQHEGTIHVRSDRERGTCFTLSLPRLRSGRQAA